MTAWEDKQFYWAKQTEKGLVSGILLWDLSAALDTLDCKKMCDKMELYTAPAVTKECTTLHKSKKATNTFVKTLPI